MRSCAHCGTSIEGYRRQAIYCGGPCRAAASRTRAAERADERVPVVESGRAGDSAQKRTGSVGDIMEWAALSRDEQARIERLTERHCDLAGAT